jgi:hypothetical protein
VTATEIPNAARNAMIDNNALLLITILLSLIARQKVNIFLKNLSDLFAPVILLKYSRK